MKLQTVIPIYYSNGEIDPKIFLSIYIFLTSISLIFYIYKILNWILKHEELYYSSIFHYLFEDNEILNYYTIFVQVTYFSAFIIYLIYKFL